MKVGKLAKDMPTELMYISTKIEGFIEKYDIKKGHPWHKELINAHRSINNTWTDVLNHFSKLRGKNER